MFNVDTGDVILENHMVFERDLCSSDEYNRRSADYQNWADNNEGLLCNDLLDEELEDDS